MIARLDNIRQRLVGSSLFRRLASGVAWSFTGSAVANVIMLLLTLMLARVLGKESYGQFFLLQSTVATVGVFAGFGVGATATRYVAALKQDKPEKLGAILALSEQTIWAVGALLCTVLIANSAWVGNLLLNDVRMDGAVTLVALASMLSALDGYYRSVLIGLEAMRAFAVSAIIGPAITLPVAFVAASAYGLEGAAAAMVLQYAIQSAISRFQAMRQMRAAGVRIIVEKCWKEWRVLTGFALPALISASMVVPSQWICQTLLAKTEGGYSELAVLGVAMQWFNVLMFLPYVTSRVVLPLLTEQIIRNDEYRSRNLLLVSICGNASMVVPIAIVLTVFAPSILHLYGPSFSHGSDTFSLIMLTSCIVAIQMPIGIVIAASSQMWHGALQNFGWAMTYIVLTYSLLQYGSAGVAAAMCIAYLLQAAWGYWFARRHLTMARGPRHAEAGGTGLAERI